MISYDHRISYFIFHKSDVCRLACLPVLLQRNVWMSGSGCFMCPCACLGGTKLCAAEHTTCRSRETACGSVCVRARVLELSHLLVWFVRVKGSRMSRGSINTRQGVVSEPLEVPVFDEEELAESWAGGSEMLQEHVLPQSLTAEKPLGKRLSPKRHRSLSSDGNDETNPLLMYARDILLASEKEETPLKFEDFKKVVVSKYSLKEFNANTLSINLLVRSMEMRQEARERAVSVASNRSPLAGNDASMDSPLSIPRSTPFGSRDSPFVPLNDELGASMSGEDEGFTPLIQLYPAEDCIGCADPAMDLQLTKHRNELLSLV